MTIEKSHHEIIQFINCRLVRDHKLIVDDLWVRNGKIINPEKIFFDEQTVADRIVNCNGAILAPGFIDIQINGGFGVDFSQSSETVEKDVALVAHKILSHGVTSFCPTIVTSPPEVYHNVLRKIKKQNGGKNGATILGIHIEGPFINKEKKGAHPIDCILEIKNGVQTLTDVYGTLENVNIITLAPEKNGALEIIKKLSDDGITVSVGHSMANLCDGEAAVAHGANLITHLFNAMLPFHHRDPGLVGLLTSSAIPKGKTVYFGIISDGIHTHPAALRIAYRSHPAGLILVTDAISTLGFTDGIHYIGQLAIEVRDGKSFIAGTDTLCGNMSSMDECIRRFRRATDCSIVYALEAASLHPAKCLNIETVKGTLNFGGDADFVLFDNDLNVKSTWIAGDCVYNAKDVLEERNSFEILDKCKATL